MTVRNTFAPILGLAALSALSQTAAHGSANISGIPSTPGQVVVTAAGADPEFVFSFTGVLGSGSGTLDATDMGSYYQVTDGTLTFAPTAEGASDGGVAETMSLVVNPNAPSFTENPVIIYDDEIFPTSSPTLDFYGLLFSDDNANGATDRYDFLNLFEVTGNNNVFAEDLSTASHLSGNVYGGTFTISAVPEPSTLTPFALMGLGLLGLVARARRKSAGHQTPA